MMSWINTLLLIIGLILIGLLVYLLRWNPSAKVFSSLGSIVFSGVVLLLEGFSTVALDPKILKLSYKP